MNLNTATRWGINALILLGITLALYLGKAIFVPLIISLLLAAILWPMANWMNQSGVPIPALRRRGDGPWVVPSIARWRVPWGVACMTVVVGLVGMVLLFGFAFGVGMSKFVIDLGDREKVRLAYNDFQKKLEEVSPVPLNDEYLGKYNDEPGERVPKVLSSVYSLTRADSPLFMSMLGGLLSYGGIFLWESILIMFILLFLLLEGRMLSRRFVEIFGPGAQVQGKAVEVLKDTAYQLRAYLVWRTIINFGMAAFLGLVYHILGLQLSWTWALLTAILWYIPYLGPIAAGVPPVLDAFISSPSPWIPIFLIGFYTVFVAIEGYVVVPVVMGRSMEMNATTVLLACLFWELVWGSTGLFLAMPLMAAVKAVCNHVPDWKPWANLMSSHLESDDETLGHPPVHPVPSGETTLDNGEPVQRRYQPETPVREP